MSLVNKIEDIQKKPESVRRRILAASMAVFMFFVIVVWVSTFKISDEETKEEQNVSTPFTIFKNMVNDGVNVSQKGFHNAFGELKKAYSAYEYEKGN